MDAGGLVHIQKTPFPDFNKILYADRQFLFHISSMTHTGRLGKPLLSAGPANALGLNVTHKL
jgi:hypothetical protein